MVNRITNTAAGITEDNRGRGNVTTMECGENSRIGLLKLIDDITDFIFVKNAPQRSDIIFIPGSSKYEVSICAAELFHQNFADYILPSGKHSVKNKEFSQQYIRGTPYEGAYRTDWEFCCHVLTGHGVGEDRIWKEDQSGHTLENAFFSRKVLEEKDYNVETAILCCQAFHARRALMSYQIVFPETKFYVVPVETQGISESNWFHTEEGILRVMGELSKCGQYFQNQLADCVARVGRESS